MTQIDSYLEALDNGDDWAVRVSDASGRYSGGLLTGNEFALGSKALCQDVDEESKLRNGSGAPFGVGFFTAQVTVHVNFSSLPSSRGLLVGICLPRICSESDVKNLLQSAVVRNNFTSIRVRAVSEKYQYWSDPKFTLLLWTSIVIGTLMLAGTCYDLLVPDPACAEPVRGIFHPSEMRISGQTLFFNSCLKMKHDQTPGIVTDMVKNKAPLPIVSDLTEAYQMTAVGSKMRQMIQTSRPKIHFMSEPNNWSKAHNIATEVLLAFSVPRNIRKIGSFEVGDDTLAPLHGLRFLSMLWVILVHTCLLIFQVADNKSFRSKVEDNFLYQTVSSGTYSVDTFFFISGSLVSFLYFRTCAKFTMKEMTNMDQELQGQLVQFITMLLYRFIRLTPPYLVMIWIVELQMKHFRDHAVLEFPSLDHVNCPKYWWRNIFYVNTFYPVKERCVIWSWYLADDTQFFVIGIILLIVAVKYFKAAASAVGLLLLASWTISAVITVNSSYIPSFKDPFANYDLVYEKPWTRAGPYLVGMMTGWFLFKKKNSFSPNKVSERIGWVFAIATMLALIYGLYYIQLGPVSSAVYVALSHTSWALALSWIIIMCMIGRAGFIDKVLSFKYLYPLSRITYCAYLIHPQLMRSAVLTSDATTHISVQMAGFTPCGVCFRRSARQLPENLSPPPGYKPGTKPNSEVYPKDSLGKLFPGG
nr:PREDICTED: nose resistant to fluoxetine protein 6-like [Bemisia tabaci]